jgi:hypothetical protein
VLAIRSLGTSVDYAHEHRLADRDVSGLQHRSPSPSRQGDTDNDFDRSSHVRLIALDFTADAILSRAMTLVFIFAAGFLAGMVNSVAGGGTLVSFPALVWMGRDPVMANVTNTMSLWPASLGAMYGFRRELGDSRHWMWLLIGPSLFGGLVGAVLLLQTPSKLFASIVPYLIFFATLLFAVQEPIARLLRQDAAPAHRKSRTWQVGAMSFQFAVGVYGGYFGAGIGILMLAALGLLGLTDIHQMNGLKNFFALAINLIAAVYFTFAGDVLWSDALVMAAGAVSGGYGGAGLARRLGRTFVRRAVIGIGMGMAVSMFFR